MEKDIKQSDEDTGKPKFTKEELGMNPLAVNLKITVVTREMAGQFKYDKKESIMVNHEASLEMTHMTKVFTDRERRLEYAGLSARAKELLGWIMYELKPGEDYLWINRRRFMKETNIKALNTYKAALVELVSKLYLSYTVKPGIFWINPHYLFQGNRIAKYPDKVIEYKPKPKE